MQQLVATVVIIVVAVVTVSAALYFYLHKSSPSPSQSSSPGLGQQPLDHAISVVDKMEWQIRSCKALGWVLGGLLSQVKAIPEQSVSISRASLLARVDAAAAVAVLPNVDREIRGHIAGALRLFMGTLWTAGTLTPAAAAQQLLDVWDPACDAIRKRYGK